MNSDRCTFERVARFSSRRLFVAGMLTISAIAGCGHKETGPNRASVSGVVNLNGTPLPDGTIRFVPVGSSSGPKVSVSVVEGSFEATAENGPVAGENRIEIESLDGPAFDDEQTLAELQSNPHRLHAIRIPPAYNTDSQLKTDIKSDEANVLHYDLEIR